MSLDQRVRVERIAQTSKTKGVYRLIDNIVLLFRIMKGTLRPGTAKKGMLSPKSAKVKT